MNTLFFKGHRTATRVVALIVTGAFLTTSSPGSILLKNNVQTLPQNLAASSPMKVPDSPAYLEKTSLPAPDLEAAAKDLDQTVASFLEEGDVDGARNALLQTAARYKSGSNILPLARLIHARLVQVKKRDEQIWRGRQAAQRGSRVRRTALSLLLLLMAPIVAACQTLFGTARPDTDFPEIENAADQENMDFLIRYLSSDNLEVRKDSLEQIDYFLNEEGKKSEGDRTLNISSIVRGLFERLQVENNAEFRVALITSLGKALTLLKNQELGDTTINSLLELYFQDQRRLEELKEEVDAADTPDPEDREKIQNREKEMEAIRNALDRAGNPVDFTTLTRFLNYVAPLPDPRYRDVETSVLSELDRIAQGTINDEGERVYPGFTANDVPAVREIYTNDRFSSDSEEEGKVNRGNILQVLISFRNPVVIPILLEALDKVGLQLTALDGLVLIGAPAIASFGTHRPDIWEKVKPIMEDTDLGNFTRAAAGRVLNLMGDENVAPQMQAILKSTDDQDLDNNLTVADTYILAVLLFLSEEIKADEEKKKSHGATLVRLLKVKPGRTSYIRPDAARAIQAISFKDGVDALLVAREVAAGNLADNATSIQNVLRIDGPEDFRLLALRGTKELFEKELSAINAALQGLGFENDYASLKGKALDSNSPVEITLAMISAIQELLTSEDSPEHSTVATELLPLLGDDVDPVVLEAALGLYSQLNLDSVDNDSAGLIVSKLTSDFEAIRIKALEAVRALNIPIPEAERDAVLDDLGSRSEEEQLLVLEILTHRADVESERAALAEAGLDMLGDVAQDEANADAVRDKAVETILALQGPTPTKEELEKVRGSARVGSEIRTTVELMIAMADWIPVQHRIYKKIKRKTGAELTTYLQTEVLKLPNLKRVLPVLELAFRQLSNVKDNETLFKKVQIALAQAALANEKSDVSNVPFLMETLASNDYPDEDKAKLKSALLEILEDGETSSTIHEQVLAANPNDVDLSKGVLERLTSDAATGSLPNFVKLLEEAEDSEIIVLAAEAIAAASSKESMNNATRADVLEKLNKAANKLESRADILGEKYEEYDNRFIEAWLRIEMVPNGSGKIGRGPAETIDIWELAQPILNDDISAKIEKARELALERLRATTFRGGIPTILARIAIRRLESKSVEISAYRVHAERKSETKEDDLFSLGFGNETQNRVPLPLFDFEEGDDKALEALARAIVHEALEGARADIFEAHPSLRPTARDPERLHRFIIDQIEEPAFPDSTLPKILSGLITDRITENKRLDALQLAGIITEGEIAATAALADKNPDEFAAEGTTIDASLVAAFNKPDVTLSERVAAALILPNNTSPLLADAIPAAESTALIVLDAAVLEEVTSIPDALQEAIAAEKVAFFGERKNDLVSESAFVKDKAALAEKAAGLESVEQVVVMLTPAQMRSHFNQYGPVEGIGGKVGFVAPLNTAHRITIHLALANELIRANFNLSNLNEAAQLLLALELDNQDITNEELQTILEGLALMPNEIMRDGKSLGKDLIAAALARIAA